MTRSDLEVVERAFTRTLFGVVSWLAAANAGIARGAAAPPGVPPAIPGPAAIVWILGGVESVGGQTPEVLGAPQRLPGGSGLRFDGRDDGLIVPVNPIAGMREFTIEALIAPQAGGAEAQRFLHIEDEHGNRSLMEIRLEPDGRWCLDTFLLCDQSRLTLIDRSRLHPAGSWHWVALRYGAGRMTSFVDGVEELSGAVTVAPFAAGRTSLGVRLNRVYWFKGAIREVRFHPTALNGEQLQRSP